MNEIKTQKELLKENDYLKSNLEDLIKSLKEAQESNRLKTEFINDMSHEIRTPMNGILGFSRMLDDSRLSDEKRARYINIIESSGKQLLHIVDEILEISKLEANQVKIAENEVCINDIFFDLFSIFEAKAKGQGLSLHFKKGLNDRESTIYTDSLKLNKILKILLENAFKFTARGYVSFGYSLKKNDKNAFIEIYVKDTGIGISPDKQKNIFESYSRIGDKLSREEGGLGLGLPIAKENVKLLGGNISVVSKIMDGSTFVITIPYKQVVLKNNVVDEKVNFNKDVTKYTILIAEDNEVNYLLLEILLLDKINLPCTILHARNGQEAVEICENNPAVNLVFMDIKMPKLNGYEATKKILKIRPNLPVIAQTAYSTKTEIDTAMASGCVEFLLKPINEKIINTVINKYIRVIQETE